MSPLDLFLQEIRDHPAFAELKEILETNRPDIPGFDPLKDNTEEWKKESGMRQGYDLCLAQFKMRIE